MFSLTLLAIAGALCATFASAADSELLNLVSHRLIGPYGGLHASQLNETHYKISVQGRTELATRIIVTDVTNVNNATIIAPELGNATSPVLLDLYPVQEGGVPRAQVFFRRDVPQTSIRHTQQISIADVHLNYYTQTYINVFFFCNTPIVTDDWLETEPTLFIRRSEEPLPDGCTDANIEVTRQGIGR